MTKRDWERDWHRVLAWSESYRSARREQMGHIRKLSLADPGPSKTCCYPVVDWEKGHAPFEDGWQCGLPSKAGVSYCEDHWSLTHIKAKPPIIP